MKSLANFLFGVRANPLAGAAPGIELTTLPGAIAYRAGGKAKLGGYRLDLGNQLGVIHHGLKRSVKNHARQRETKRSLPQCESVTYHVMQDHESETFIRNVLDAVDADPELTDAGLAVKAGVNRRMILDMRQGRVMSPKLSSVIKISRALGRDPGEMMGIGPREKVQADLAAFLSQYDEDEQVQILQALSALPRNPA